MVISRFSNNLMPHDFAVAQTGEMILLFIGLEYGIQVKNNIRG